MTQTIKNHYRLASNLDARIARLKAKQQKHRARYGSFNQDITIELKQLEELYDSTLIELAQMIEQQDPLQRSNSDVFVLAQVQLMNPRLTKRDTAMLDRMARGYKVPATYTTAPSAPLGFSCAVYAAQQARMAEATKQAPIMRAVLRGADPLVAKLTMI